MKKHLLKLNKCFRNPFLSKNYIVPTILFMSSSTKFPPSSLSLDCFIITDLCAVGCVHTHEGFDPACTMMVREYPFLCRSHISLPYGSLSICSASQHAPLHRIRSGSGRSQVIRHTASFIFGYNATDLPPKFDHAKLRCPPKIGPVFMRKIRLSNGLSL